MLLKLVQAGKLQPAQLITHRKSQPPSNFTEAFH
jgi:hypothetical protein